MKAAAVRQATEARGRLMAYRTAYASQAETARRRLHAPRRNALDKATKATIGTNPYGHGSVEAKPGERDYR
ncbi:hypothetical protein [Streptomyces sp. NBC_00690]|uniref:hypothetical protein n=1 Tax=Streptomyces sp. NBC_00690 TaxID=2975808 RepID=UPI002E2D2DF2|nr:hypothetical protein [Streptomyces sp. NBC_00690]